MKESNGIRTSLLCALVLTVQGVSPALAADAGVSRESATVTAAATSLASASAAAVMFPITATIDSPPVPNDPDGTCSVCSIDADGTDAGERATIEIYFEDDGQDFVGDFEFVLTLDDDSNRYFSIVDVEMEDQTLRQFVVEDGSNWDWNDVVHVSMEAVPE